LPQEVGEIRIFSRDEKKQEEMRYKYSDSRIRFYIGDVRDAQSLKESINETNFIFHAAALKQVPSCEFYPIEAFKTNVFGSENVIQEGLLAKVDKIVCLSTDKAVYPINAMGISKAMMEKVFVANSRKIRGSKTIICGTRYGNVIASRGSVVPRFINQIKNSQDITITDPDMTRFMMTLSDAIKLVLFAFENGENGEIFVQKSPSATVKIIAQSVIEIFGDGKTKIKEIGVRHGEKKHECLISEEEMSSVKDLGHYFKIPPDGRGLDYEKYEIEGTTNSRFESYTSANTRKLSQIELTSMLNTLNLI
jgi:UDP-glucose 4-epimerase